MDAWTAIAIRAGPRVSAPSSGNRGAISGRPQVSRRPLPCAEPAACNTRLMQQASPTPTTGAESVRRELFTELNIPADGIFALRDRLDSDFSADHAGFQQLDAIGDEYTRAVVSDQLARGAGAMLDNLLEAHIHAQRVTAAVGEDGIEFPTTPEKAKAAILRGAELDADITGFARALCSALDSSASCAIGVLRIPTSILRAQLSHLNNVPAMIQKGAAYSSAQRRAWEDLLSVVEHHKADFPEGWFEWLNGMRVLNIHRARQVRILLQRRRDHDEPQLAIVTEAPIDIAKEHARFDLHLRRRPQLPDMQDLIETRRAADLWINEAANTTLPGVFDAGARMVEGIASFLLDQWDRVAQSTDDFPPPSAAWDPPSDLQLGPSRALPRGHGSRERSSSLSKPPARLRRHSADICGGSSVGRAQASQARGRGVRSPSAALTKGLQVAI
jgi:hypothetical protein